MTLLKTLQGKKLFFSICTVNAYFSLLALHSRFFSIFLLTGQSSNKGSAINISGSLRMQSYVVTLTVAEYATREQEQKN